MLATETVLQLARAVDGIKYGERRVERVKGFAQPVTAVEILPADRAHEKVDGPRLKRAARRAARQRSVQGVTAVALPAGSRGVLRSGTRGPSAAPQIAQHSLGVVNPRDKIEAQPPLGSAGEVHLGGLSLVRELGRQGRRAD